MTTMIRLCYKDYYPQSGIWDSLGFETYLPKRTYTVFLFTGLTSATHDFFLICSQLWHWGDQTKFLPPPFSRTIGHSEN